MLTQEEGLEGGWGWSRGPGGLGAGGMVGIGPAQQRLQGVNEEKAPGLIQILCRLTDRWVSQQDKYTFLGFEVTLWNPGGLRHSNVLNTEFQCRFKATAGHLETPELRPTHEAHGSDHRLQEAEVASVRTLSRHLAKGTATQQVQKRPPVQVPLAPVMEICFHWQNIQAMDW